MLENRWKKVNEIRGISNLHHFEKFDDSSVTASLTGKSPIQTFQVKKLNCSNLEDDNEEPDYVGIQERNIVKKEEIFLELSSKLVLSAWAKLPTVLVFVKPKLISTV